MAVVTALGTLAFLVVIIVAVARDIDRAKAQSAQRLKEYIKKEVGEAVGKTDTL